MIAKKRAQNRYTMGYVLAFLDISKRILVYQSSITTTFAGISLSLRVTSLPISAIVYPHSGTYKFRFGNAVFRYLYGNILGRFSRVYSRFLCLLYAETIIPRILISIYFCLIEQKTQLFESIIICLF